MSVESVEDFRLRARRWLADNLPPRSSGSDRGGDGRRDVERGLQRRLWDGGFAGICFPAEHGGLGLTPAHQAAFTAESLPYDMPYSFNVPTLGILAATLIDFGSHEQKAAHLPAILRGEELWVQFLSEPSGGSDLAGCRTQALRDGDEFVLNGSKIWSSAAFASDYAMCLARTDWDAPKHRGLTMFILKIHQPGIQIDRIRQVDGSEEFCQEFFDDVRVPAADVVGEVDQGWTVATRLLMHERQAVGGGSPYVSGQPMGVDRSEPGRDAVELARAVGRADDPRVRRLVAEAHVADLVHEQLVARIVQGLSSGTLPAPAGSIMKLSGATTKMRRTEIDLEIAGVDAVTWPLDGAPAGRFVGEASLSRQSLSLGGGSNEMQRNLISERLLGMPREHAADRDVPYRDVPTSGGRS
ncbi:MAG: acyl-CoA dehydrogenase [Acidimicrobiales bacterium]|nr:acyl-CoA dehydrogenase [Acidimicrobiales bacterium]